MPTIKVAGIIGGKLLHRPRAVVLQLQERRELGFEHARQGADDVVVDEGAKIAAGGEIDVERRIEHLEEVPHAEVHRLLAEVRIGLGVLGFDVALVGKGDRVETEVAEITGKIDPRGAVVPRRLLAITATARRPDVGGVVEADGGRHRGADEQPFGGQPLTGRGRHQHDVDEAGLGHLADGVEVGRARREVTGLASHLHRRRAAKADVAILGVGDDEIGRLVGAGLDGGELAVEAEHGVPLVNGRWKASLGTMPGVAGAANAGFCFPQ